ncbi:MAG TPA: SIMPL domain-containing protein, partial [Waddliaceae bacterium]
GSLGATNISSLQFVIDNPDAVDAQARDLAIADAKAKAQVLAKSLGVRLTKIVSFDESSNQPIVYPLAMAATSGTSAPAVVPQLPVGQNTITSNVTITYEIQ